MTTSISSEAVWYYKTNIWKIECWIKEREQKETKIPGWTKGQNFDKQKNHKTFLYKDILFMHLCVL